MTAWPVLIVMTALAQSAAPAAVTPSSEVQVAAAILAAPAERRGAATVLGYDEKGALVTLRQGTNDLICLADNPKVAAFSAACYHKDLEPFMARGRELAAQGVTDDNVRSQTRWKEIESGTLVMPRAPRTLYVLTGKGFDASTGQVIDPYVRWVIYVPFATPESTGLSTKATPGGPWLMNPGTAGAHIMISPPRQKQ